MEEESIAEATSSAPPVICVGALNPIRYRGYYYDVETGFYWLMTRYYNPEWRRFINADVFFITNGDPLKGANMYSYCRNMPVMRVDPNGMEDRENGWASAAPILILIGELVLTLIGMGGDEETVFAIIGNALWRLESLFQLGAFIDAVYDLIDFFNVNVVLAVIELFSDGWLNFIDWLGYIDAFIANRPLTEDESRLLRALQLMAGGAPGGPVTALIGFLLGLFAF